jgi:hypothetical protein
MSLSKEDFIRLHQKGKDLRKLIVDTTFWAGSAHIGGRNEHAGYDGDVVSQVPEYRSRGSGENGPGPLCAEQRSRRRGTCGGAGRPGFFRPRMAEGIQSHGLESRNPPRPEQGTRRGYFHREPGATASRFPSAWPWGPGARKRDGKPGASWATGK